MDLSGIFRRSAMVAATLAAAASVHAAGKDVEDLLAHMRNAYRSVKSATFTTETHAAALFTSTFLFKSPSKIRVDVTGPKAKDFKSSLVKISDGKQIALKMRMVFTYSLQPYAIDSFSASVPVNLESLCFYDWEKQLSTAAGKNMHDSSLKIVKGVSWKGKKWTVLEETARKQNVFCRYFIDPKTFLIWRTTVTQPIGGPLRVDAMITKLNLAANLPDSKFDVPPDHP